MSEKKPQQKTIQAGQGAEDETPAAEQPAKVARGGMHTQYGQGGKRSLHEGDAADAARKR